MKYSPLFRVLIISLWLSVLLSRHQPARSNLIQPGDELPAIDSFITQKMHEMNIPGLALVVVREDQVLLLRGYGKADTTGRPVTPQTPFLAASLSKPVTALAVMQLVEAGKLKLDAPVVEFLPWFRTADLVASSHITIRHLLYHASGLSEFEGDLRNLEEDRGEAALETSLRRLSQAKLNAAPGERFEYSNTNYDLLGLLIQTVSGKPYNVYIQEEIFAPLGMHHAHTTLEEARLDKLSSGYISFFGLTLPYEQRMPYSQTVIPSAGLFLSAEDLARFLTAQLNQGQLPGGVRLLSSASMEELHTPGIEIAENVQYAMGWTRFRFSQAISPVEPGASAPLTLAHGGDWANYKALMLLIPEHRLGVAMLINKQDWSKQSVYDQMGWNTALLALGLPVAEFPVNEDFLTRSWQIVGSVLVLLLISSLVYSVRRLMNRSGWDMNSPQRRKRAIIFFIILPLIDLLFAGIILLVQFDSLASLQLEMAFAPDSGLLYLLILTLTLGGGAFRMMLAFIQLYRTAQTSSTQNLPLVSSD